MRVIAYLFASALMSLILTAADARAQHLASRLDDYLNAAVSQGKFSGSVLIAREGEVILSRGYGMASLELGVPNTPQTKFRIGSLTKQFTAMAVMILQERGKLRTGDSVCNLIPECPRAWAGVTVHHLLTHTSGIPDLVAFPDFQHTIALPSPVDRTVERFRTKPLEFEPGRKFKYSNSGYVLLGYIIERVTGQTYDAFLKENILGPLKMFDTGNDRGDMLLKNRAAGYVKRGDVTLNAPYIDMSIPTGGGSLYSTVGDLFLWDQALYAGKLIAQNSYEAMFKPYVTADWGDGAAYGWFIGEDKSGHKYMGFQGGINGFAAQIMRYPDQKVLLVILSNFSFAPVGDIQQGLAAIIFSDQTRSSGERVRAARAGRPFKLRP